jgi:hypothetical protein
VAERGGAGDVGQGGLPDVDAGELLAQLRGQVRQRLERDVGAVGRGAQDLAQQRAAVRAGVDRQVVRAERPRDEAPQVPVVGRAVPRRRRGGYSSSSSVATNRAFSAGVP